MYERLSELLDVVIIGVTPAIMWDASDWKGMPSICYNTEVLQTDEYIHAAAEGLERHSFAEYGWVYAARPAGERSY